MQIILACFFALMSVAAADRISDYHEWHQKAVKADDSDDIDKVIEKFQAALEKRPDDQLARVYLGSSHTLRASETFWGPSKLKYIRRGEKLMNQAIDAAPDDPRVRFIRAVNAYRLPKRFEKRPVAVADFSLLMPVAKKDNHGLTVRERQAILYFAYLTFSEEKLATKATEARNACLKLDPNSHYGQRIQE